MKDTDAVDKHKKRNKKDKKNKRFFIKSKKETIVMGKKKETYKNHGMNA